MAQWIDTQRETIDRLNRQVRRHLGQAAVAARAGDKDAAEDHKMLAQECERRVNQLRALKKRKRRRR